MSSDQIGVSDSLSSSTDTLDDPTSSPNKLVSSSSNAFGPTMLCNYTRSPGRSVPHSNTTHNFGTPIHESSVSNPIYERGVSADPTTMSSLSEPSSSHFAQPPQKEFVSDVCLKSGNSSDNEQNYTTIKRSPKSSASVESSELELIEKPKNEVKMNDEQGRSGESNVKHFEDSFTDAEASDFMKQLRMRRQNLNAVDKDSLPFWDKDGEKEETSAEK